MVSARHERRDFLKSLAALTLSGPVLARLELDEEVPAGELDAVPPDGASVCWDHYAARKGYAIRRVDFPLAEVPGLSAEDVVELRRRQIRPETRVLVFPHVDNIIGLWHLIAALTTMAKAEGVEFVAVDGARTAGIIPLDLEASGVDAYAASPRQPALGRLRACPRPGSSPVLHLGHITADFSRVGAGPSLDKGVSRDLVRGTGCARMKARSSKEAHVRRLIGTALILGFALIWRADGVAGQYSWSNFSFSVGVGSVGFGVGLSYSSVDPWYDIEYHDPCWDYTYYDWYSYRCRYSYYDAGYYDDLGYDGYYQSRRWTRLSYGYVPWRYYYPSYWGYGYWGSGIHLSFGSLYPYNWFGYGYGSHYYGSYYGSYYGGRVLPTYAAARPTIGRAGYARARSTLYGSGLGYKESPRTRTARRVADDRAVTAAPSATSTRRTATTTPALRGSVTAARSPQRRATAGRVQAPTTRASANRAARAESPAPRARPSDALRGRTTARSSATPRARAPSRAGSSSRAAAPSRRSGGSASARPYSPGLRAPSTLPSDRRTRARSAPSTRATPSARMAPSTRRPDASRPSPTTRSNLQRSNLQRPNPQRSRPSARTAPPARSTPSTRAAPSRQRTMSTAPRRAPSRARSAPRTAPSRARSAPPRSARRAPSRPAPSRSVAPSRRPPTRSAAPSRSSGRRSAPRAAPSRSSGARSAPARGGSSGRSRSAVRRPRGG